MTTQFGFLSYPGSLYEAEIPDVFGSERGGQAVVALNGMARTINWLSASAAENLWQGKVQVGNVAARGRSILVYEQPSPRIHFLYWKLGSRYVWTFLEPDNEGDVGLETLLSNLDVHEDESGQPRISLRAALSSGDIRRADERDLAFFYSSNDRAWVGGVTFSYAGGLASDNETREGDRAAATRGTALGINVTVDGPSAAVGAVRKLADDVAASLATVTE
ncbi:MAG: hypothetical protein M3312_05745 [Actinomycetota bacterium]|nr:hypothetical protein [Actinomycetota bacterium]